MSVLERGHRTYFWVSCILLRWRSGADFGFEFESWDGVVFVAPIAILMEWFWTRSSKVRVDLGALASRMEPWSMMLLMKDL